MNAPNLHLQDRVRSLLSRRGVLAAAAAAGAAAMAGSSPAAAAPRRCRRRRAVCTGRNWCMDRSHTCGEAGGYGKCLLRPFGASVCAEILFQAASCADCEEPACSGCLCVLAAGGGDRCNNGTAGFDYICAREVPASVA